MVRSLTAGMVTETTGDVLEPVLFFKMAFASGDLNVWSGIGDKVFNSDTYTGVGDFGGVSNIEETGLLKAASATFTLSGIPSSIIATTLTEDYSERFAKLWLGMLDSSKAIIADPYLLFVGRMDVMEIEEGPETSIIKLSVVNRLVDLERPKERRYTAEDQKEQFSGDLGLDFVASLNDGKQIVWGKG